MSSPRHDKPLPWAEGADEPDYDLLPIDPDVLAMERQRKADEVEAWEEAARNQPIWEGVPKTIEFKFQFSLKDMFAATTIIAFALAAGMSMGGPITFLLVLAMGTLSWVHLRLLMSERTEERNNAVEPGRASAPPMPTWREFGREVFRYSVADMLIATTVAACVFALLRWLKDPSYVAGVLSLWVFGWIAIFLLGARPSRKWWLIWAVVCVAYLGFSIVAVIQK